MKKIVAFFIILVISIDCYSQNRVYPSEQLRNIALEKSPSVVFTDNLSSEKLPPTVDNILDEEEIGNTYYDLQSNASSQNRIYLYPDGYIGSVFTYGLNHPAFSDRGTGYNIYDGNSWGSIPTQRLESDRCGWPSYAPWGNSGEIVAAHYSGASIDGIVFSKREQKGFGSWTEFNFYGPDGHALLWPRMITSGLTNNHIHLLALTTPSANGGTTYEGQDGALVYSRSSDGGTTWEIENVIIEGLGSAYYTGFESDIYEFANPTGNTLAIVIGNDWTDLILLKSTDNGDSWQKTVIWEHPYPLWNYSVTDEFFCPDGAHSVAFDNSGKVHVAFGINKAYSDGTTQYWFPLVDGVAYWNEDMATFSNNLNALSPYGDPGTELTEDYNLIGWMQDLNGNGQLDIIGEIGTYYLGSSSMPQLIIDEMNQVFLIYSSVTETYDNGVQDYRHLWARGSGDNGVSWGDFIHLNSSLIYVFSECVYPSCSPTTDNNLHLIFQDDNEPGLAVRGDEDPYGENDIRYMDVSKESLITILPGNELNGYVTEQVGGALIENATIYLEGTAFTTISMSNGYYSIPGIPAGIYTAVCEKSGYLSESYTVEIEDNNNTTQDFSLTQFITPQESFIGNTFYDLQSNASMQNRFYYFDDGTFGGVWTMGFDVPAFPDRGTGYSYYNGFDWSPAPMFPIESVRTGWPSYTPLGANGELIVSHDYSEGELVLSQRSQKGTGEWNESSFEGPENINISWNRTVTSGENHEVIQMLSLTWPVESAGSIYEGLNGAILYSRSFDGGISWEEENDILEGMNSSENVGFSADTYEWAAPQEDKIAFLVGSPWTDLYIMRSDDEGTSWEKKLVWNHPYPMFDPSNPIVTDTFYCPDGAHTIAFDSQGKLHVAFGIVKAVSNSMGVFVLTEVDGIAYWNEDMDPYSNNLNALSPYGDPGSELIEDQTLIAWSQDIDENGFLDFLDDWGEYYLGISSMPQLVIDEENNMFLVYSSVTEFYDNGEQNYRHLWARGFNNLAQSWGEFKHLNSDLIYIFSECVFPSCASRSDENIHLIFMEDSEPGLAVRGDLDPYGDNSFIYMNVLKSELISNDDTGGLEGVVTNFYTGAAEDSAYVLVVGVSGSQVMTGADGYYFIPEIPAGNHIVKCLKPGYLMVEETVVITANTISTQNFQIKQAGAPSLVDVGTTYYDLQSNGGMSNRMFLYPGGNMGAVFTRGLDYFSFPDRRSGYNYFDGSSWGALPVMGIESDRAGWPSYAPWNGTGEIVVSHYSGASVEGLAISSRPTANSGNWNELNYVGPTPSNFYLWPRATSGGTNYSDLHLIALTAPVANGGTIYQQMDGALLYSRSPDGGQTWDYEHVLLDEINSNYFNGFSGDVYEIQAQGNNIAFVVGDVYTSLVLMKSADNGDIWEKTVIWDHPYPFLDSNSPTTEDYYFPDGAHCLVFDQSGKVHVAFGISQGFVEFGAQNFYQNVDGIGYWNEDMPTFSDNLNALSPYGDPGSEMITDYNLIGWSQDLNGNGELDFLDDWGVYYVGVSSMPQLVIDELNNVFLVYSSVTEGYDNGIQNYRHLWARGSNDNGQSWGDFHQLTADITFIFTESVFPSCSPTSDDKIHLVFQQDYEPGMAVRGDEDPYGENKIVYMSVLKTDLINLLGSGTLTGLVTSSTNGFPLVDAEVELEGTLYNAVTTPDGLYEINNIFPGDYTVNCTALGFYNASVDVTITPGDIVVQDFEMIHADDLLPPQNLEAIISTPDVQLVWLPPASGSPLSYNVYRNAELIGNTSTLEYLDENVQPGDYEYFVTALYENGESEPSNFVYVIAPEPCYPPENVSATVVNQNQIELTWDPPASGSVIAFNIYRDGSFIAMVSNTSFYSEGLAPGTYEYCVSTVCMEGESEVECADPVTITTILLPPTDLTLIWFENIFWLIWTPPDGMVPNGYNLYHKLDNGNYYFVEYTLEDNTEFVPQTGMNYFYVTAVYDDGESEPSNVVSAGFTGVVENNISKISVFPNPAKEKVFISSDIKINTLTVYNFAGNEVLKENIGSKSCTINISRFNPGIFLLRIKTGEGVIVRRIVVE